MPSVSAAFFLAALLLGDGRPTDPFGYVTSTIRVPGGTHQRIPEVYVPQPGDLVLFDDHKWYWLILYHMVGSAPPTHSAIVVRLPNGGLALLESGPDDGKLLGPYVALLDLESRLKTFDGTLLIRRLKRPLAPERDAALTNWSLSQIGKRYATGRLLLQGTPFRVRNPLTRKLFGKTGLDRGSYLCSEVVVAAGTVAGLFDPKRHPANAIYPLDMTQDTRYDLSGTWHKPALWSETRR